jgi:SAM-dependent methyltransferase
VTNEWNDNYLQGFLPWDTDEPEQALVQFVRDRVRAPGRVLDVGCGTGTHSLWLAQQGFDVLGIDVAERAIELARQKAAKHEIACRFATHDFLAAAPEGPFDFVFDRGCFHVFDEARDRERFAASVASCLAPTGQWLSLMGSTEGAPREHGPPRRSVRDIANAIEPALEIAELRAIEFDLHLETRPRAWLCVSRPRSEPAQPSTVHLRR